MSGTPAAPAPSRGFAVVFEGAALAALVLVTVGLPIVEIVLRTTLHAGIEGVSDIVQHLTLALGMLGAAVAARERRLLTLATSALVRGPLASSSRALIGILGAAVSALLALAAVDFVRVEYDSGARVVSFLPNWVAELPLVAGFSLIALRTCRDASDRWPARLVVAVLAACVAAMFRLRAEFGMIETWSAIVLLLAGGVLGTPVFAVLGGIALMLLLADGVPAASVAVNHYGLVTNPTLPALPMFTLAGYLLAESRAPQRLLEVFDGLFGRLKGGAAIVTVLACTFFTCFTGASGVAILTLGGLVMPLLLQSGFRQERALGLVTAAGLPGVILMPALPLLLYAIVAGNGIEEMFVAGLMPALIMLALVMLWGVMRQDRQEAPSPPFDARRVRAALWAAKWELTLPAVPVFALASSLATPVEAAAFTAAMALFIVTVVHRDLRPLEDVPRVIVDCGVMIGGILLVLGVALSLTNYMVDAEIPARLVSWVTDHVEHRWVFLLALNGALLLAGCVMDIFTAIVVLVPLVAPLGAAFQVHPVHLGIVFLANLEIGYLTPPVGMNLFFASYRFGRPIAEVFVAIAPLLGWLALALAAITFVPWLSTGLLALR